MCKFIGVEILAANALIELLDLDNGIRSVSYETLNSYGIKVVEFIENNYNEKAVILTSKVRINSLVLDYSDYFEIHDNLISVKEGVSVEDLRDRFRGPLALEILMAILSDEVKGILTRHI